MVATRAKKVSQAQREEVLEAVDGVTLEQVTSQLATTKLSVNQGLANLEGVLMEKVGQLKHVESAIGIRKQELSDLHQIEVSAITLDELSATIQQTRESWQLEQEQHKQQQAAGRAELEKARKREEEDYTYRRNLDRQKADDAWKFEVDSRKRAEDERQRQMERGWSEREQVIEKQEKEILDLRQRVANIPNEIKAEKDAAVAIATNSLKRSYETDSAIKAKDAEVAIRLANQDRDAARTEVTRLSQSITELRTALDKAHTDARAVAEKALDASAGRQAMEAMRSMHERPDQGNQGGKR